MKPIVALPRLTRLWLGLAAALVVSCDAAPESDADETSTAPHDATVATPSYPIDAFMESITYRGLSFSPDGTKLATGSDAGGVHNVVEIDLATGAMRPLTTSTDQSKVLIGYFPGDERILYSADKGGNELAHLYVRELDGSIRDLTPGDSHVAQFHGWSADGTALFFRDNARDPRDFDLFEMSADTYEQRIVYQNDGLYVLGPVSPDRRYLALMKGTDNRSQHIELHDFATGENHPITLPDMHIFSTAQAFSPDGRFLYYTTDKWREFQYLARYDLTENHRETVLEYDWDVVGTAADPAIQFSRDGRFVSVRRNENARRIVDVFDAISMTRIAGSDVTDVSVMSFAFSPDASTFAFIVANGRIPGDIMVSNPAEPAPRRMAASLSPKIEPEYLVAGEVKTFQSFDGLTVPGILYKPPLVEAQAPALVWVHGGPGGQNRIGYEAPIQFLVNHGYVVFAVNNRGSDGSGKTFYHLDDQDHGNRDLRDVIAAKRFLIDSELADPARIGVIGGSYGGYLTLAALAFHPDEFAVGVDVFGVSNWSRTFAVRPPWWEATWGPLMREMGDLEDDAHWRAVSPLFHAERIKKPLLVVQGANDPRVVKIESDEIVEKVRANGVPVEYVVFDDEGHGIAKKANQIVAYRAILEFLDRYLKAGSA